MLEGISILVIEDDKEILGLLTVLLEGAGYRVLTSMNGVEALAAFKTQEFAAIILDYKLPDTNANDLIIELEKLNLNTPVIIVSANLEKVRPHSMIKSKIRKPFNVFDFVKTVKQFAKLDT